MRNFLYNCFTDNVLKYKIYIILYILYYEYDIVELILFIFIIYIGNRGFSGDRPYRSSKNRSSSVSGPVVCYNINIIINLLYCVFVCVCVHTQSGRATRKRILLLY